MTVASSPLGRRNGAAKQGLFALELDRPCARPAFVFDGPSHRLDGHLKLVKVFNRRRPHGIILSRQCLPQLGDSALKNTKILVWVHCHALHPAIGLWPKGGATIMRPITEECEAAYIVLLGSLPTGFLARDAPSKKTTALRRHPTAHLLLNITICQFPTPAAL